jgi:hypothetical protein
MKILLRYTILLLVLLCLQIKEASAAPIYWVGNTLAAGGYYDWNDPTNWFGGVTPGIGDDVVIGLVKVVKNPPTLPIGASSSCKSITFGALLPTILGTPSVSLTVNGTLTVSDDIYQSPTLLLSYTATLRGTGELDCNGNVQIGDNITFSSLLNLNSNLKLISTLTNFHIAGNVTANATVIGVNILFVLTLGNINGTFSLQGGTTLIDGQIFTRSYFSGLGSPAIGSPKFSIDMPAGSSLNPILKLSNTNAINTSDLSGSIDFYNNTGGSGTCTVEYAYNSTSTQTVYSTINSPAYLDISPALYQNLTFSGTGLKLAASGLITVAGTIDNSASSPIDFVTNTNTVQLTGTNQSVIGGAYINTSLPASPVGTVFYNLTSSASTVTLSGRNDIAALGTLAFLNTGTASMSVNANALNSLTLLSNSNGDASIASLSTDASSNAITATIAGSINVQRYVIGGGGSVGPRRYMLISSPVANASANTYNLLPLFATTYITGPGGSGNGFDTSPLNTPSAFIYDENSPLTANVNVVVGNEFKGFNTINETVPMANGVEFYFRGSRTGVSSSAAFISPFPAPDNATLNFSGAVYKGAGTNGSFTANIINFIGTPPTYYSSSAVTVSTSLSRISSAPTKLGLNLLGNPYPSVIDLHTVYTANSINYRYFYMLVKNISTGPQSYSTKYATYDASNAGTPPAGASRYAVSGQGFFVVAPASSSSIVFNETMKVPYSSYKSPASSSPVFNVIHDPPSVLKTLAVGPNKNNLQQVLATSLQVPADPMPRLRLELMRDTAILNTADISFDKNAKAGFVPGEDAPYIAASGQGDFFYSQSADSVGCFVNYTSGLEKLKRVNLFIAFAYFGTHKITSPVKSNIDERYTIYLKDRYTNDSLDVVHNSEYNFNVDKNPASYARDRFYLSIGIAPGHDYKLLSFNGAKITAGIQLNWKTDNESNFTKFAIEKSTNDGKSFIVIDSLQSTSAENYTFTDPAPGTGQITYRLIQTLVTGDTQLSKNLSFDYSDITKLLTFMVYPSNAVQDIHIRLGKTYSNNIKINIISANGSMVKTITASNTDTVQQNVGGLIKGLYIVDAIDEATGKRIGSAKFLKQ